MAGNYTLIVTNSNGCTSDPDTTTVIVNAKPTATASSNSPVSTGATIQLYGGPNGMTSYSWIGPGGWTSMLQNPTRTGANATMAGTYTLVVTNSDGCIDDESTTVTVGTTGPSTKTVCKCLRISTTGGGSVITPGEGWVRCYPGGVVCLIATPDAGYRFVGWTGDVSTIADVYAANTTIIMYSDFSTTANFEEIPPPPASPADPTVTTQTATWVGADSATLNMDYTVADLTPVQVRFARKISTDSAWYYTAWLSKGSDGSHAEMLTGLISQTTYKFKAQLKYESTVIEGNTLQFTTGAPATPEFSGGCFIATAAYGTPTAEQIDVLREFRDVVLMESTAASQFVTLYYQLSPPVADVISRSSFLRTLVRELLVDPVVWAVEATGEMWRN
jgi:hypothetical protein